MGYATLSMDSYSYSMLNQLSENSRGVSVVMEKPLSSFGGVGTGGFGGVNFSAKRPGYPLYVTLKGNDPVQQSNRSPYQELMEEIQKGFDRTFSHLPVIFGVSRQTLYNWRSGETPKQQHHEKLIQLAEASHVFIEAGFKPDLLSLDRVVSMGKSFIVLLSEGANGKETAQRLIRLVKRGKASLENLDEMIGNQPVPRLTVADMGRPLFKEDV